MEWEPEAAGSQADYASSSGSHVPWSGTTSAVGRATNPGSKAHPNGCKPCNKFNPARPHDSCKHDQNCEFCHELHERPKHRGQRGRHALQRRQYLESRGEQPAEFTELVDQIYKVPHTVLEEIKRLLASIPHRHREEKVLNILERIKEIGENAQNARPDNSRLRGARVATCDTASAMSELDGRFKWLVGTLHLLIRKMWDAKEPQERVRKVIVDILDECQQLPKMVDSQWDPSTDAFRAQVRAQSAAPPWVKEAFKLGGDLKWLESHVRALAARRSGEREEVEALLGKIKDPCDRLPNPLKSVRQERLRSTTSLEELSETLHRVLEECKQDLFRDDDAEETEHEEDIFDYDKRKQTSAAAAEGPLGPLAAASSSSGGGLPLPPPCERAIASMEPRLAAAVGQELRSLPPDERAMWCRKQAQEFLRLADLLRPRVLQ